MEARRGRVVGRVEADELHESPSHGVGARHDPYHKTGTLSVMVKTNRRSLECGEVRVQFIARKDLERPPVIEKNTPRGPLRVASPAGTALELVSHADHCGGLDNVASVLAELVESLDPQERLAAAALCPFAWVQRLGYLLDVGGHPDVADVLVPHGTHAVVMDPLSFIGRLCALIPPPRMHMLRFCGVVAAHNKLRAEVVPAGLPVAAPAPPVPEQLALFGHGAVLLPIAQEPQDPDEARRPSRHAWAFLMQHVFAKDVLACPHCQGRLRLVEVAKTTESIARVLADAGLGPRAPPRPQAAWPGQLALP